MEQKRKMGILIQVYILVIVGMILTAMITYYSQLRIAKTNRQERIHTFVHEVTGDAISCVLEYPAHSWLLAYWYNHADTLDIEYDVDFSTGTETKKKCAEFYKRHPELQLRYIDDLEAEALPEEDQKLYAEIIYSWLITDLNQLRHNYNTDFLYCVVTDTNESKDPYSSQFFMFSAADDEKERGLEYMDVYPLGKVVSTAGNKVLQEAMREAVEIAQTDKKHILEASVPDETGQFVDEYCLMGWIEDKAVLVGISFNLKVVMDEVAAETRKGTLYSLLYQYLFLNLIMANVLLLGIHPLKRILKNIRMYAERKDGNEVRKNLAEILTGPGSYVVRRNEIGQLAEDFMDLTEEVDDHVRQIRVISAAQEKIAAELSLAAGIQSDMVPSDFPAFPDRKDFDLYALMNPAKEVGGDFYDYYLIDEDHLALVIADVSGKGVPAALFMTVIKALIKNRAMMGESPGSILENVNMQMCDGNKQGFFVTVWMAVLELSTGRGVASNAGHEHPALARAGGAFELIRYKHSPVIGMLEDISFREHTFELNPGDRLFVYTDGAPEATDEDNEMFGTDRMLDSLNKNPEEGPDMLLHKLRQDIDKFTGQADQFDDITMLCLWYKGPEGFSAESKRKTEQQI